MPSISAERLKHLVVVQAGSNLGLMPQMGREPGTRRAPEALRALGLHARLDSPACVAVPAPAYDPDEGRTLNIRNMDAIARHAVGLADAVAGAVSQGKFPLVLGGDCSLLVGSMLGLRRLGPPALVFIDGHTDFFLPEQSGTGGAAGLDLALACGWGPPELTDIEGRRPYVDAARVAALGNRDHEARPSAAIPVIEAAGVHYRPLQALRAEGIAAAAQAAVRAIAQGGEGYWIHLDVDVLDSVAMPAVDSPQEDGLSFEELGDLLRGLLAGPALGMQVTIYDPDRDPDGAAGRALVDCLATALAS